MKNIIKFLSLGIVMLMALNGYCQKPAGFEVHGKFVGMQDGLPVYMKLFNSKAYHFFGDYVVNTDSAITKNGEFNIKGTVPDGSPRRYVLSFGYISPNNGQLYSKDIELWISNGDKISVSSPIDVNKLGGTITRFIHIDGSPATESYLRLINSYTLFNGVMIGIEEQIKNIRDSLGFNPVAVDMLLQQRANVSNLLWNLFLKDNKYRDPDVVTSRVLWMQLFNDTHHSGLWPKFYAQLPDSVKNSFYGRWAKEISALCVGQPLPSFKLPAPDGKQVLSDDLFGKSKLTLVHLWSQNSKERKKNQDEVRAMQKMYGAKGLQVVGLFHDDFEYKRMKPGETYDVRPVYENLLKQENFPWLTVADLDYKNGVVEKIYREGGGNNTTNILVDEQGKIVAWDPKGAELQYFIWKKLGNPAAKPINGPAKRRPIIKLPREMK